MLKDRIFGLILFLCLIAPVITGSFVIEKHKNKVRKEIKKKYTSSINRKDLVFFKFSENEKNNKLDWKHSKEFEYKGEMYDVVESEVKGDTTYYWCWWDYEETLLNHKLNNLVSNALGKNSTNQDNHQKLIVFFKSLFFSEYNINETAPENILNNVFYFKKNLYISFVNSPPVPPPEIV